MRLFYKQPKLRAVLGASLLVGALALNHASWAGNLAAVPMTMTPIYTNTAIGLGMIDAARRSTEAAYGKPGTSSSHVAPPSPAPSHASFDIGRDAALSNKIKTQFLNVIRAHNSAQVTASISSTFANKPVRAAYLEAARPYGLGDSDLRDVATAYMVVNWMIANQADLPTQSQVAGVRHQLSHSMEQKPTVSSAVQRQTAAEEMMYDLVSLIYARQEGQRENRTQELSQMANLIATTFEAKRLNLRRLALTDSGFAPR